MQAIDINRLHYIYVGYQCPLQQLLYQTEHLVWHVAERQVEQCSGGYHRTLV